MRITRIVMLTATAIAIATSIRVSASGPLGIYGVIEKVVFEPNEKSPERIQVWGAFAYVDGGATRNLNVSSVSRGYLYFALPAPSPNVAPASQVEAVEKEWGDLRSVAGTGQAVGFGSWFYTGGFGASAHTDVRVRPASELPSAPTPYLTNAGVVKLSDTGNRAALVKQLREALR